MRAIVIAGGTVSAPAFFKSYVREDDLIICADSGYLHCEKMGLVPDLVIGDFDSCRRDAIPENIPVKTLPVEKDETDLHTCINYAIGQGAGEILVFGSRGSRLDHSLAAISLVYMGLMQGVSIRLIDEHNELFMFEKEIEIPRKEGYKLSLLPVTPATGIDVQGLYYPLENGAMDWGNPYGVSNEFVSDVAKIRVKTGVLMAILSRD
ncbi:MAG: thiamine diphosphokinase [Clostridia bacterium]|nr:thiamine diphosphokinase [Clostridia bacterium]